MISQEDLILKHLKNGNALTPLQALNYYGCFRLSGRIYDLKKQGHEIKSRIVEVSNGKRVAEYYIPKQQGELF